MRSGELCCALCALRQHLLKLLLDAEGSGGRARPEFTKRMSMAVAPGDDEGPGVIPALAKKGDDAVGKLAEGNSVEGCVIEPVDDERMFAADTFESFGRRAFRCRLGGLTPSAARSISSPPKVLLGLPASPCEWLPLARI
jgi:hypothetical protein